METKEQIEQKLNSMKNGENKYQFDVEDTHEDDADEEAEAGKKKKPWEKEDEPNGKKDQEDPDAEENDGSKKKPKGKKGEEDDDDTVVIATTADGSSISADLRKSESFFEVAVKQYSSNEKLNKALLSRTKENIKLVRAEMRKAENRNEVNDKIHDVCKEMEAIVNDEARRSKYSDNGMAKALALAFEPYTELSYALLAMTPTHAADDQFSIETRDLFADISEMLQRISTARTASERILLLMTLGSQYRTLFQSHSMISGEVNFVNGRGTAAWNQQTFEDLWAYYLYDVEFNDLVPVDGHPQTQDTSRIANIEDNGRKWRGQVGDNAQQPDITIVKPFFLLFVDDKLLYELRKLHISEEALSVLGNYAIPTELWGENADDKWEPEHESYKKSSIHCKSNDGLLSYGDAVGSNFSKVAFASKRPDFEWSHNGTLNLISNTPAKLAARNTAFINEVKAVIQLAESISVVEVSEDVAFFLVLTNWLNAVYKYMIDINGSFIQYVEKGIKANTERFIAPFTQDVILKTLTSFTPQEGTFEASSVYDLLIRKVNLEYDRSTSVGYTYSPIAYNYMKDEFSSVTYMVNGDDEFHIGKVSVGTNKILITLLQKLYLPINLMAADSDLSDLHIKTNFMSSTFGHREIEIANPYLFATSVISLTFNKRRGASETGLLTNVSLFHLMMKISCQDWNNIINDFFENQVYTYDGRRTTLGDIFNLQPNADTNAAFSKVPYIRVFNPMTPAYKRAAYLQLVPLSTTSPKVEDDKYNNDEVWLNPLMDQAYNTAPSLFADYTNTNQYLPCSIGWMIQSLINEHADFSWILQSIFLTYIKTKLTVKVCEDNNLRAYGTTFTLPVLPFCIKLTSATTGTVTEIKSANYDTYTNNYPAIPYSTYARRRQSFLKKLGYNPEYINSPIEPITISSPKTALSTNDIIKAFRFVPYAVNEYNPVTHLTSSVNYIIDNKFADAGKSCAKTIYYSVGDPDNAGYTRIQEYRRIIRDGEAINITESEIRQQVINPDFLNEGFIIFDDYHVDNNTSSGHEPQYNQTKVNVPFAHAPYAIENTNLVGYRVANISHVFPHMARQDLYPLTDNNLNRYCYIPDDFYPCCIVFGNVIPFSTQRSEHALGDNYDKRNSFNNLTAYDLIANVFHRVGFDKYDFASTHSMLAALVGLDPAMEVWELPNVVRDKDEYCTIADGSWADPRAALGCGFYARRTGDAEAKSVKSDITTDIGNNVGVIIKCGILEPRELMKLMPGQIQSFRSSLRYPKLFVAPSSVELSGLPIYKGSRDENEYYINSRKAINFFKHFNSVVPDQWTELYASPETDNIAFYNIQLQGNPNYSGTHNNQLTTSFTIKEILSSLGIFFNIR